MCTAHGVHGVRMPCICRARAMYTRSDRLPSPTAHPRLARPPLTATRPPHAPRSGTAPHPSLASLALQQRRRHSGHRHVRGRGG
eukprot:scaffold43279_cov36-Phaeocystis_antarctica.AAC.1